MDHGSQRYWFRPILRCFKLDFFGEALQRSEYIFEMYPGGSLVWPAIPFQRKIEAPLSCAGAATKPFDAYIFEVHLSERFCGLRFRKLNSIAIPRKQLVVQRECTSACWVSDG
jgi:hypothetical protein